MDRDSRSPSPSAPIIVLLPDPSTSTLNPGFGESGEPTVLGLGLARRTALAARRAGYSRVYFQARDHAAPKGIPAISDWRRVGDGFALKPSPLIIVHGAILAEPDWLEKLINIPPMPANWAAIPHKMIVLAAPAVKDAIAVLEAGKGAFDLTSVQQRLTQSFGAPGAIPAPLYPPLLTAHRD